VVKLFPAPHDIPLFLRQVLGPLPDLRIFPTAGVTPDNFEAILAAGAFGVGFVSSLLPPDEMARGDWAAIERRAASIISRMSK
jgi:2-dehydro-3-deoxyphosphogluconate aldolase/(4S)-4-hydroxy-2-oxoglutarate aldolase